MGGATKLGAALPWAYFVTDKPVLDPYSVVKIAEHLHLVVFGGRFVDGRSWLVVPVTKHCVARDAARSGVSSSLVLLTAWLEQIRRESPLAAIAEAVMHVDPKRVADRSSGALIAGRGAMEQWVSDLVRLSDGDVFCTSLGSKVA